MAVSAESVLDIEYLVSWQAECTSRLEGLLQSHEKARLHLDAHLESQVHPSTYSAHLVELMQREERAANQGMWDLYSQLIGRVDAALSNELDKNFHGRSQAHQRQWAALLEKQVHERDRFATDISDQILELANIAGGQLPVGVGEKLATLSAASDAIERINARPMSQLSRKDLERRLYREGLKHWGLQERFNLKEAAALQKARVDAAWSTYIEQLEDEHRAQRAAAEGKLVSASSSKRSGAGRKGSVSDVRTGPWRNAEKQSRLVHTAPVLTPEIFGGRRPSQKIGSTGARRKSSAAALDKELAALDHAHGAALERVEHQKGMALRWIDRQSMRMTSHLAHVEKDKELILYYLEKEEVEADEIRKWITTFASTAQDLARTRKA